MKRSHSRGTWSPGVIASTGHASTHGVAVDALGGVDVDMVMVGPAKLVSSRMDAVDRAYLHAGTCA
jgi:hypothetical protein